MDNNDMYNANGNINKKSNVFNVVIGIATLLIALLGATFAYFSATASSNEGAVNLKSAYITVSYDQGTIIEASELIPSSMNVALTEYRNPTNGQRCLDAKGKQVCYVYQFTVSTDEDSVAETEITGSVKVESNKFNNLSYVLYEVDLEDIEDSVELDNAIKGTGGIANATIYPFGSKNTMKDTNPDIEGSNYQDVDFLKFQQPKDVLVDDNLSNTVYPNACLFGYKDDANEEIDDVSNCKPYKMKSASQTFHLVVWLEETGTLQNDEQNTGFSGTVNIEVNGASGYEGYEDGKVTGTTE